ncbi:hypothetical protein MLD38_022014 [Melastoma candidum]|uniref:Uncharacterized protein n=1 Tax=Melastoma candidum TaxID=119954 RepID=A0ACB9QH27_9MYRT|nr:hypothetical protein MLD38_022014 [Melastoma candidum]
MSTTTTSPGIFAATSPLLCGAILLRDGARAVSGRKQGRVVVVRFNQGFGGGGGGGRDNGSTARVVGNLALAIGLTYLSLTGQLGWVLDAIVSIRLAVVLIPIFGFGGFFGGRDVISYKAALVSFYPQSASRLCPNCGNDFQVFKSSLNDELQLCPCCSQPFSVVDNKFVWEPVKFSNQFTSNREAANEFFPQQKKGKDSSRAVVDTEAEVVDAD